MARKTKRTKRTARGVDLRAKLERFEREERRRRQLDELRGLEHLYSRNQNPLAAMHAYRLCRQHALPLPAWVLAYFDGAVGKAISIEPTATKWIKRKNPEPGKETRAVKSVAPAFARAFGITRPARLNLYDQFGRDLIELYMFLEIRRELAEHGRKYGSVKSLFEQYATAHNMKWRVVRDLYNRWLRRYGGENIGAAPFPPFLRYETFPS
jgi:hypothetical protein